jgi:hypothetical protein
MKKSKFITFKEEIVKRAKDQSACIEQFKKAVASKNFAELFTVIKDNFNWACDQKIIDIDLLMTVRDEANKCDLWVNETTKTGYLLVSNATVKAGGNATVKAGGNATVEAWGNATVEAGGNATVKAGDNATVKAWGNATVKAGGNATVEAWGNATVKAGDNATVKAGGNATVKAGGNATVEAWGNATVKAWDNAFISSWKNIECKLSDQAIFRNTETCEITIIKGSYKILNQKAE